MTADKAAPTAPDPPDRPSQAPDPEAPDPRPIAFFDLDGTLVVGHTHRLLISFMRRKGRARVVASQLFKGLTVAGDARDRPKRRPARVRGPRVTSGLYAADAGLTRHTSDFKIG